MFSYKVSIFIDFSESKYVELYLNVNVDLTVVFVIINNVEMMINVGVNAKNYC